jgi:hypothetical protein
MVCSGVPKARVAQTFLAVAGFDLKAKSASAESSRPSMKPKKD